MIDGHFQEKNKHAVVFHGKAGELFVIYLVSAMWTALTFGIYSAWAKVRIRRYFYGNTEINGERFDYHAEPTDLLKQYLKLAGGIILFFILSFISLKLGMIAIGGGAILMPVLIMRELRFNANMTSYRGIRFDFLSDLKKAYWVLLGFPLVSIIGMAIFIYLFVSIESITRLLLTAVFFLLAMMIFVSTMRCLLTDLVVNNLLLGRAVFNAKFEKTAFIKIEFIGLLIQIPFFVFAGWLGMAFFSEIAQKALLGASGADGLAASLESNGTSRLIAMFLVSLFGILASSTYKIVALRNYLFSCTTINGNVQLHSSLEWIPFFFLQFTNVLMIIFSLGFAFSVAQVRYARYMANATHVIGDLSLITDESA